MFGFIKRVFGMGDGGAAPTKGSASSPDVPVISAPVAAVRKAPPAVLQRDEIIDAKTRIAGYRFSARRPDSELLADTATTLEILSANKVAAFAERRLALIPLTHEDWMRLDCTPLIGPLTTFLLTLPDGAKVSDDWNAVAAAIHGAGARIALAAGDIVTHRKTILEHADYLLLDFPSLSLSSLEALLRTLRQEKPGLELIADKVGRWPEHRYCVSHGIAYCLGTFTTEPDEEQKIREIGQSQLVLIEMLNQLRKDAELADIAQIAKRDPGVIVKVMAMANSPMAGLSQPVTSIDQAIMVLGREQLYRWLSIGMFRAGAASPRDEVLLELALGRGRFLELLGQKQYSKLECDEFFLLGLLSLLDSLLGLPMSAVVAKINLSPVLMNALLNSDGPLARYLMLSIAVEKGRVESVARLADELGYSLEAIESASVEAIGWAEEAVNLTK
ncbi:MAG: HDOD domain-containing protein [Gammaproteobacteria bacterium]|nr:HDOD domain-containing protein [Gammaproteobacteria bacterium]MBU1601399.1 HDOD domain-containing protein [Gammaproteobacteria bacterium]MBU2433594.1 HDOD domain-containing protein [Gammaproteobacteria bacterium]MBU2449869.1 HDOD domain-containing protein [Gammaproteobacteria bacterium]